MMYQRKLYLTDDDGAQYVTDTSSSIIKNQSDKNALFVF